MSSGWLSGTIDDIPAVAGLPRLESNAYYKIAIVGRKGTYFRIPRAGDKIVTFFVAGFSGYSQIYDWESKGAGLHPTAL